ncbi:MAG: uridine kinase [Actinomycetota bacterium]|nr:uridine kinase [Actinomycetota bacterium]
MLLDGPGAAELADALVEGLTAAGRAPLRVRSTDFWRPPGQRYEYGREDVQAFRELWLDEGALRREVLEADGTWLPALWDAARERSARAARRPLPPRAVLLVDGVLLLGRGLPADLTVHVALSPAALRRRGVPEWQLRRSPSTTRRCGRARCATCSCAPRAPPARRCSGAPGGSAAPRAS